MKISKNLLKQIIIEELRNVLKEVDMDSCNKHSLGFIDDKGNFLDIIQYAASYGILFGLISLFLSIYIVRVYG